MAALQERVQPAAQSPGLAIGYCRMCLCCKLTPSVFTGLTWLALIECYLSHPAWLCKHCHSVSAHTVAMLMAREHRGLRRAVCVRVFVCVYV